MIQDIKNRIKLFKTEDHRKPFEIYCLIKKSFNKCFEPVVGELFTENWKWSGRCYHALFLIISSGIMYSSNAYENRHNRTEMLFSVCMGLFDILGLQMMYIFCVGHDEIFSIMLKIEDYIKTCEQSPEAQPILLSYLKMLEKVVLIGLVFMLLGGVAMALAPILIYLIFGRMQFLFYCFIPFVDYTSHPGFEIHVVMHGWMVLFFIFAVGPMVGIVVLFLAMAGIEVDILRMRLSGLSETIVKNNDSHAEHERELKRIYYDHQDLVEFMGDLEEMLSMMELMDHFILGSQICMSLFICIQEFWLPGYIIVLFGTGFFFMSNLLGTIIEWKFEKLMMDVWDVPWYLMNLKNQKDYLYFLANTQKTDWLTVGGQAPLCLDTFVRLYKGIYSDLMILRETQG